MFLGKVFWFSRERAGNNGAASAITLGRESAANQTCAVAHDAKAKPFMMKRKIGQTFAIIRDGESQSGSRHS
jgi:hypothetical protein